MEVLGEFGTIARERGYAAASQGAAASTLRGGAAPNMMLNKGIDESTETSWVPDPVTGYYRPENRAKEIDAAELRALLLKNATRMSVRSNHFEGGSLCAEVYSRMRGTWEPAEA
ncbi:protein senescence-associated protein 21 [Forsythia ovata]|uniref:Protein senescence-associated protein 21 n=1 Tax=Forsythia ovata TaxID=205694 RepID=A0ABD1T4U9_9LAMI